MQRITLKLNDDPKKTTVFYGEIISSRRGRTLYRVDGGYRVAKVNASPLTLDSTELVLSEALPEITARIIYGD